MDRQRLMLTMSSSGGKWLASTIAKHLPGCVYYDKEFFNPICNPKYEPALSVCFGCELVGCYRNIASTSLFADNVIDQTWGREGYTFTKEVYSPLKLPLFLNNGFDCFVLLRTTHDCLPPVRGRVWSFYEHCWHAFREAGYSLVEKDMRSRAYEVHALMYRLIERSANEFGVPILRFEELMTADVDAIAGMIHKALGTEAAVTQAIANELVATRFREERPQ